MHMRRLLFWNLSESLMKVLQRHRTTDKDTVDHKTHPLLKVGVHFEL